MEDEKVKSFSAILHKTVEDEEMAVRDEEEVEELPPSPPRNVEAAKKTAEVTGDVYNENLGIDDKPSRVEVIGWYLYEFCSYFIITVLIPIVFPLIISQTVGLPESVSPVHGSSCTDKELRLYQGIASKSIHVKPWHLSPLSWVSASWILGMIVVTPLLGYLSSHLDYSHTQQLIAGAATLVGAIFCLPAGSLRKMEIFPPYIAVIVIAHTVAMAAHTRNLGLMIRGFVGPTVNKSQFRIRTGVSTWLSLMATASGCSGAGLITAFAYGMLVHRDMFISLWVVSIFSAIIWLVGTVHVATAQRPGVVSPAISPTVPHIFSIFSFPQGIGALLGVVLGSFTSMCVFAGGILYVISHCVEPPHLIHYWLIYFGFPLLALPAMHPLKQLLRANSIKMQIMGLALSVFASGVGFYYRKNEWKYGIALIFAAIQGTSTGLLYASGRVVTMDCAPVGKDGAFAAWHSWARGLGSSIGYTVAVANPGNVSAAFGAAFCIGIAGIVGLIYGNVNDANGAVAAGHATEWGEKRLPEYAFDKNASGTIFINS
ncbi:hypothetical protein MLD38_027825 [Melastoma candidum]|uniref:Uncharacterized protein n=1 Tax=Melastoma candidum TaxID=119954 RepID=A0ACB9P601_9MYRT|nr:hypothetical protein MLD38_027825 [Melastoma candidum]